MLFQFYQKKHIRKIHLIIHNKFKTKESSQNLTQNEASKISKSKNYWNLLGIHLEGGKSLPLPRMNI